MSQNLFQLPEFIDDGRLDTLLAILRAARGKGPGAMPKKLRLDWQKTHFVSAAGLAVLCCLADSFYEQRALVECLNVSESLLRFPVVRHLARADPLPKLVPPQTFEYENAETLLRGYVGGLNVTFLEQVEAKFGPRISEETLFAVKLIVNELMQNSVDHSTAERYYLYAGRVKREMQVGILDMGVTIPAKLSQAYDCESDVAYLELALKKGVSTRRQREGGFGLFYTFDLLKQTGGRLTILSRGAQLRRYFKTRRIQKGALKRPLSGTWCFARVPTGNQGVK